MATIILTTYVLVWPVIVAIVLGILVRGFLGDWRKSRRAGERII